MTRDTILIRRGTAAAWTTADTVLLSGELGYETDTGSLKVGDGSTPWTTLPYRVVPAFGIGVSQDTVVAATVVPFSYCPFAFTVTDFKQFGTASGSCTVTLYKNDVSVYVASLTTTLADAAVGVSFAVGDNLKVAVSAASGSPTVSRGVFLCSHD